MLSVNGRQYGTPTWLVHFGVSVGEPCGVSVRNVYVYVCIYVYIKITDEATPKRGKSWNFSSESIY